MTANPERAEIEDLKARVDLVELIRQSGVELTKSGKAFMGHCPFHDDSTASLAVTPGENLWNCFGCEAGGDAVEWIRLKEKLDFPQALARLKQLGPAPAATIRRPDLLARVCEVYHRCLMGSEAPQTYLKGRGLGAEVWKAFRVGFCDGSLLKTLPNDGEVVTALQELGLLTQDKKEHFRGCVVVPLTHPDQGVVGFYGRRIRPDAKVPHLYLPGPRQGVLNWQALKASSSVLVAESVIDALSLWQAGAREATCVYGVQGLTEDFRVLLKRFEVKEVTLCLDGDRAGLEATQKFSGVFQEMGLQVSAVRLPEGQDPSQLLAELGGPALLHLVRQKQEVASVPVAAERQEAAQGFLLEMAGVTYNIQPMPPFTSRLRINLRAHCGEKWLQDRFDLYVHRDRVKLATQIVSQLGLPRIDAERHQEAIFRECDGWAAAQKLKAEVAAQPKPVEMTESERLEALQFLRQPDLKDRLLRDIEALAPRSLTIHGVRPGMSRQQIEKLLESAVEKDSKPYDRFIFYEGGGPACRVVGDQSVFHTISKKR